MKDLILENIDPSFEQWGEIKGITTTQGDPNKRKWWICSVQPFKSDSDNFWVCIYSEDQPDLDLVGWDGDGKYQVWEKEEFSETISDLPKIPQ